MDLSKSHAVIATTRSSNPSAIAQIPRMTANPTEMIAMKMIARKITMTTRTSLILQASCLPDVEDHRVARSCECCG